MRPVFERLTGWKAGGALHAPCRALASWLAWLIATLAFAGIATAQVALPEQKLSSDIWLHHFDPQIRAVGQSVFGVWGGGDTPPHQIDAAYSPDGGKSWIADGSLPLIWGEFGARLPVGLYASPLGGVNLMTQNLSLVYFGSPTQDPPTWAGPVIAEASDGYLKDVRAVASDLASTAVYLCYTHKGDNFVYAVRFIRSLDNGATWSAPVVLSSPNCNGSSMVVGPDGTVYVTWVDYALGQVLLRRSTDHGATFSPPVAVAGMLDNLNGGAVGWRTPYGIGQRFYPYYRNSVGEYAGAPNFPALAIDRSDGPTRGWLYLAWADHAAGTPAPATTTVIEVEPNHNPAKPLGDYSLAQLVPLDCDIRGYDASCCDGAVYDLDWYTFDGVAGETIVLDGDSHSSGYGFANLFVALPGGERLPLSTVVFPGLNDLAAGAHPRPAIVTLSRTGRYVISAGGGTYTIRLRRLNVAPGSLARDMRDIVLARSIDGGATWSPRVRVNHDGPGADQSQPNVAVDGQGRVYVAWYDRRGTALGNTVHAYASASTDGGATFGPDLRLSSVAGEWIRPSAEESPDWTFPGNMIGDRIALAAGDDFGMAAWTDLRAFPVASVYAARLVDIVTAVTAVSDLAAEPLANGVRLRWRVNDARGLTAISVLRREGEGAESVVGEAVLTGAEGEAAYEDATARPGGRYAYRLRVATGSRIDHLGPIPVTVPARITALAWGAAGPNPFAQRVALTLAVPRACAGVVRVYDVQGKVVRTLHEGPLAAGEQSLAWDGRDAAGAESAPGLYFVAAQAGDATVRTRLTRVR